MLFECLPLHVQHLVLSTNHFLVQVSVFYDFGFLSWVCQFHFQMASTSWSCPWTDRTHSASISFCRLFFLENRCCLCLSQPFRVAYVAHPFVRRFTNMGTTVEEHLNLHGGQAFVLLLEPNDESILTRKTGGDDYAENKVKWPFPCFQWWLLRHIRSKIQKHEIWFFKWA